MDFWNITIGDIIAICFVPVGVVAGYLLAKWLKNPIQRVEEENQEEAYASIFTIIETFDEAFECFYLNFEEKFLPIKNLNRIFLPIVMHHHTTRTAWNGTVEKGRSITFDDFKKDILNWEIQVMTYNYERLEEFLKFAVNMIPIKLHNLLIGYTSSTISYMNSFQNGYNRHHYLSIRLMYAKDILHDIEDRKITNMHHNRHQIKEFVERWKKYIESES